MKISRITVGGFKNLKKTVIDMKNIVALVALNNYGKSNLFQAMRFAVNFMGYSAALKKQCMHSVENIPLNKHLDTADFDFEIVVELTEDESPVYTEAVYHYSFRWPKNDAGKMYGAEIIREELKLKPRGEHQKYETVLKRDEDKALFKASATGRCSSKITADSFELVLNKLAAYDNLPYLDVVKVLLSMKMIVEKHFDAEAIMDFSPISFYDDPVDLSAPGVNIADVLLKLKEKYNIEYLNLIDVFKQLVPSVEDVQIISRDFEVSPDMNKLAENTPFRVRNTENKILVKSRNINQYLDISMLSSGTKRILVLLLQTLHCKLKGAPVVALEEPENSIHPELLQNLLEAINDLRGDMAVIYASHSPNLIQYMDIDSIYFGIPNEFDYAVFKKINSKFARRIVKNAEQFDMSLGDFCFWLLSSCSGDDDKISDYFGGLE